jgi:hypothetical protein
VSKSYVLILHNRKDKDISSFFEMKKDYFSAETLSTITISHNVNGA